MENSYKAVIFDLGRVLFHWNPYEVAKKLQALDQAFNVDIYKITQTPIWHLFDIGHMNREEIVEYFSKDFSKDSIDLFLVEAQRSLLPLDFGVGLLKRVQAKNISTYLLSNLSREFHAWLQPRFPFLQTFRGSVYSYQVQVAKPDPKIYLHLLENYLLDPKDCLFIDDLESNIYAAKKLGIDGILFQNEEEVFNKLKAFALI